MKVFGFVRQKSAAKFIMAHIIHGFRRLGFDCALLDMEVWKKEATILPIEKRPEAIQTLISDIKTFKPDIVISYGLEAFHPLFSDIIEGEDSPFFSYFENIPFLCFFFDFGSPFTDPCPVESIPFIGQMQSRQFLFFCWDKDVMKVMQERGISKCVYFPMGVNEETFKIIHMHEPDRKKFESDFCFVGGPTQRRIRMLEAIHDFGLKIYGYDQDPWLSNPVLQTYYEYPVFKQDELVKIYNASFSTVNITRAHGKSSLNMRVYESMACGSLLLTDDKRDARELFTPDKEILIYKDEKELRKKAKWILNNRVSACEIARRGRERILEEHTYPYRVQILMPIIEQFCSEFSELKDALEKVSRGQYSDSLRDIDGMINGAVSPLNIDMLYLLKAQILMAKGQIWSGKKCIDQSLKVNPQFIRARMAKKQFEAH